MNKSITLSEKDIARFWSKVEIGNPDECWEWKAPLDTKGYGNFQISHDNPLGRNNPRSHRVSWFISFGENAPTAKLTESDIVKIRILIADGETQRDIAKKFNVKHNTIGSISRGVSWKHVIEK